MHPEQEHAAERGGQRHREEQDAVEDGLAHDDGQPRREERHDDEEEEESRIHQTWVSPVGGMRWVSSL